MKIWKDIEFAPKDGTPIDLWHENGFRVTDVWWDDDDGWTCLMDESCFTHFADVIEPWQEEDQSPSTSSQ